MDEKDIEKLAMERVIKEDYKDLSEFYKILSSLECADEDKAMFLLSRYGIKLDKLNLVKWNDIDRENMLVNFNNSQLPIDKEFLKIIDKLENDNETILNPNLTKEKVYTKTIMICKNNNIPRISFGELFRNRTFDLLVDRYKKNNRLSYNDFKDIIKAMYGEKKLSIPLLIKRFEVTMDIEVIKAI